MNKWNIFYGAPERFIGTPHKSFDAFQNYENSLNIQGLRPCKKISSVPKTCFGTRIHFLGHPISTDSHDSHRRHWASLNPCSPLIFGVRQRLKCRLFGMTSRKSARLVVTRQKKLIFFYRPPNIFYIFFLPLHLLDHL